MTTRIVFTSISTAFLLLTATGVAQAQTPQFGLVKLPPPPGASVSAAGMVDQAGNALGTAQIGSREEVVEWVGGTNPVVYPRLAADQHVSNVDYTASGTNVAGAVIGQSIQAATPTTQPIYQGIYWDPGRHPIAAEMSGGLSGISDTGIFVGTVGHGTGGTAAYWTNQNSHPALLPYPSAVDCADPVANECYSSADAISPNGKYIVGAANLLDFHSPYGVLWVNGAVASNYGAYNVGASEVTDSGVIIGSHDTGIRSQITPDNVRHAFRWEAGTLTDLGALPGAPAGTAFESDASSINSSGVIVGSSQLTGSQFYHAVMWLNGQIVDLHESLASQLPPGFILNAATSINDSGEIVLQSVNPDTGESRSYLAKPLIPTHTTITSNISPSTYGQQIHLIAKVSPDSGPVPITGNVSWYDNGALLGTARLTSIGTSSWEPSSWTGGVHNVTAVFPGSSTLAESTSPVFRQTVNASSTRTTISASANPATPGQAVLFIATVVPTSGTIAGTVTFEWGSTVLGTGTLDPRTKQARFTTTFKTTGTYSIRAVYVGSQNFLPSASSTVNLTVK
jgi:probable HAF family extracellular repeat protein